MDHREVYMQKMVRKMTRIKDQCNLCPLAQVCNCDQMNELECMQGLYYMQCPTEFMMKSDF